MRILGIDFGTKRIGIAVSDPLGFTAQGISTLEKGKTFRNDIENLKEIIEKYEGIREIVVGLPKKMSGEIGIAAQEVLKFVEALKKYFNNIEIKTWDERLTSAEANKFFAGANISEKKRRKIIDKTAAVLILQGYLDSIRIENHNNL